MRIVKDKKTYYGRNVRDFNKVNDDLLPCFQCGAIPLTYKEDNLFMIKCECKETDYYTDTSKEALEEAWNALNKDKQKLCHTIY